jgi:glucokinase
MILAGDVGGTKARLALYETKDGSFIRQQTETFASQDFASVEEVVQAFLQKHKAGVSRVCIGVPAPVVEGIAKPANLPWELSETRLTRALGMTAVKLVNDLVATTSALPFLSADDLVTLHPGQLTGRETTMAVLAPGTGLGQSFLFKGANQNTIIPSEAGHADFAPNSDLEIKLLRYLQTIFRRVSYERVTSGPGLVNIYNFLKDTGEATEPPELAERMAGENPAAVISSAGQTGEYEICVKALDLFVSVLGAQAGNLVLTILATGGVYLGGGMPPKILNKLRDGAIVASYLNKGRLSNLVAKTPLYVIRDDHAALLGAAYLASTL